MGWPAMDQKWYKHAKRRNPLCIHNTQQKLGTANISRQGDFAVDRTSSFLFLSYLGKNRSSLRSK
jgi:hypothetical protein